MPVKQRRIIPAFEPADYDEHIIFSLRALAEGTANNGQQQAALKWIIEQAAKAYDVSYRPGADGERDTAFAEGRRFVALQIIKVMKLVKTESK